MKKLLIYLIAGICALTLSAWAQDTNELKTTLGLFDAQTGLIIIKGYGWIGSLSVGTEELTVLSRESIDTSSGHAAGGISIEIIGTLPRERVLVDYDEIDQLLAAINYLNKITYEVTPLPSFEAFYSTKSGLRVVADSVRREGGIKTYIEYGEHPKILVSSVQLMQFYTLIEQAKKNLDSIKPK